LAKKAVVIGGDGTGPELTEATLKVLRAVETGVELIPCEAGSDWWKQHGGSSYFPDETWAALKASDACFKGPTTTLLGPGSPRSVAVTIRQSFDLYANIRPIKTIPGMLAPLGDVDFLCVREATEGLYSGIEYRLTPDVAIAVRKITRRGCERIVRKAFAMAEERGWKTVVAVHKANVLKETCGLFLEEAQKVAKAFPGIELQDYIVDNMAQQLLKNPQRFNQNVIVGTNLFMDILTDEAGALVASVGCLYSANIGDSYAMFEPAHGSAPKYAGLDKVNPTAAILSGAWMLQYLGEREKGDAIFKATEQVIAEGKTVTYDLKGTARTSEMAQAIAQKARQILNL